MHPITVRRWEVIAAFMIVAAVATVVALWNGYRIHQAERRINRNTAIAVSAKVKAAQAVDFVENFQARIHAEKVCTESNRGDPCRALFQRLSEDLSAEQRLALACEVARNLQLPQYKVFCTPN